MLIFDNVTKRYHYEQYDTISGLTLTLSDKLNTLLIDTQSGKTTLCKLVLGLEKPTNGSIYYNGVDVCTIEPKQLDATYLCKELLLFDGKTALYNVAKPLLLRGYSKQDAAAKATQALAQVGVDANAKVSKLCVEDKVGVVLARLFARGSSMVLVDDFLPLLTPVQTQQLMGYLTNANCFVLHLTSQPDLVFGKVYLWHDGKIVTDNITQVLQQALWLNKY